MFNAPSRLLVSVMLILQGTPVFADACDHVIKGNGQQINACVKELKSEISQLKLQLRTEKAQNEVMRCLLANEMKTLMANDIADVAGEELHEAAKKKTNQIKKTVSMKFVEPRPFAIPTLARAAG
jgi:hypothetical protein